MVKERVANELRSALQALEKERDEIDEQIELMQGTLSKLGVSKAAGGKKAGRKKAGRKKAAQKKTAGAKKKRGAKKKQGGKKKAAATKKKAGKKKKPYWSPAARAAARERMRKYWADRNKG